MPDAPGDTTEAHPGAPIIVQDIFPASVRIAPVTEAGADSDEPANRTDWTQLGFVAAGEEGWRVANGIVVLEAPTADAVKPLMAFIMPFGGPPCSFPTGLGRAVLYRIGSTALAALVERAPAGVRVVSNGETIQLPAFDDAYQYFPYRAADELPPIDLEDLPDARAADERDAVISNPLLRFSLRGQSERFKQLAIEAKPLLGEVCLQGQVSVWYAAPGTGKTLVALSLVIDAVRAKRIAPGNVFYVNADDNGQGFATKIQIMDDLGCHTLAPGFKGFAAADLTTRLVTMAERDEARDVLVIIDTIKKFANLMDKKDSSEFAQACRRVAMMGGTILGLAHTTKNKNADGSPRYAGTSDLIDDADSAYVLALMEGGPASERVVLFTCLKSRGDNAETAAYSFAAEKGASYEEKVASVTLIDAHAVDEFKRVEEQRSDDETIQAVIACITEGIDTKMSLAKAVAQRAGGSSRAAIRIIEKYTGDDPSIHRWNYKVGERGKQVFAPLPPPP